MFNVKNGDQQCFKWAVLSALFPAKKDAKSERRTTVRRRYDDTTIRRYDDTTVRRYDDTTIRSFFGDIAFDRCQWQWCEITPGFESNPILASSLDGMPLPRHRKLLFSLLEGYCHGELLDSISWRTINSGNCWCLQIPRAECFHSLAYTNNNQAGSLTSVVNVRPSSIHGRGVFAVTTLRRGEDLGPVYGRLQWRGSTHGGDVIHISGVFVHRRRDGGARGSTLCYMKERDLAGTRSRT